jgi:hypothetical protein
MAFKTMKVTHAYVAICWLITNRGSMVISCSPGSILAVVCFTKTVFYLLASLRNNILILK